MAGSITWFEYQSDRGNRHALRVDRSNGTAVTNTGVPLMLGRLTEGVGGLPANIISKRYVYAYALSNKRIRRKFWVGNPQAISQVLESSTTIQAEDYPAGGDAPGQTTTWIITAYRGEKNRSIPPVSSSDLDTGLTDSGNAP